MKRLLIALALFGLIQNTVQADDGLITVTSTRDVATTADKLEATLKEKGMTIFDRIDHAAGAQKVGLTLEPTVLVIFGNPKVGTLLMQCGHSIAIDLPLKVLVWEDADGKTQLTYNDPAFLAKRHNLKGCEAPLGKVEKAMAGFVKAAAE